MGARAQGVYNPYQVRLMDGTLIYAPMDDDGGIMSAEDFGFLFFLLFFIFFYAPTDDDGGIMSAEDFGFPPHPTCAAVAPSLRNIARPCNCSLLPATKPKT